MLRNCSPICHQDPPEPIAMVGPFLKQELSYAI
jgi:hypothetical protein